MAEGGRWGDGVGQSCFAAMKVSHSSGTWEVNPGCLQLQNVLLFMQNKCRGTK